jgi:hypothetical protein
LKALFSIIAMLLVFFSSNAQITPLTPSGDFLFDEQRLLLSALSPMVVLVRQEYVLRDSLGNDFGSQNRPYFGRVERLGVSIKSGIIYDLKLQEPWLLDKNYELSRDKVGKGLVPILSETSIRLASGGAFFPAKSIAFQEDGLGTLGLAHAETNIDTLPVEHKIAPISEAWLLSAYQRDGTASADTLPLRLSLQRTKIAWATEDDTAELPNFSPKSMPLGGILCNVIVGPSGKIQFKLLGFLLQKDKVWYAKRLFNLVKTGTDMPTPITKQIINLKKKSKKND